MSLFDRIEDVKFTQTNESTSNEVTDFSNRTQHHGITADSMLLQGSIKQENNDRVECNPGEALYKVGFDPVSGAMIDQSKTVRKPMAPDFETLSARGMTGDISSIDVDDLDSSLFLFALDMVRSYAGELFMEMGHRYVPHWRKRLPPIAWPIIEREIKQRLDEIGWSKTK